MDAIKIAKIYDVQVKPLEFINNLNKKRWKNTRAEKVVRYHHHTLKDQARLWEKERWSIEILKTMLKRCEKPVISCSFGVDSILSIYLTRKALEELGRNPSDIDIVWNDTKNEFQVVREFAKEITEKWELNLITTTPKKVLKKVINDHGGVSSDYFGRKGNRTLNQPLSEKCCNTLKHEPMRRATKENEWDGIINGLRYDESNQRLLASLRDGEFFYSSGTWKAYVCRPILWWDEEDVWDYIFQENIPYNKLYDQNLVKKTGQIVDKKKSIYLKQMGFNVFTPRTGCQMCPIPVKYGYLHWMRTFYPKVYDAMVHKLGYGKALLKMVPKETREEILMITGVDITEENAHEYLQEIIEGKPCVFDEF